MTHHDLDAFAAALDGQPVEPPAWGADSLRALFVQVAHKIAAPGSIKPEVLLRDPVSVLTDSCCDPLGRRGQAPRTASPWH